jgi:hypothetical protein
LIILRLILRVSFFYANHRQFAGRGRRLQSSDHQAGKISCLFAR